MEVVVGRDTRNVERMDPSYQSSQYAMILQTLHEYRF